MKIAWLLKWKLLFEPKLSTYFYYLKPMAISRKFQKDLWRYKLPKLKRQLNNIYYSHTPEQFEFKKRIFCVYLLVDNCLLSKEGHSSFPSWLHQYSQSGLYISWSAPASLCCSHISASSANLTITQHLDKLDCQGMAPAQDLYRCKVCLHTAELDYRRNDVFPAHLKNPNGIFIH